MTKHITIELTESQLELLVGVLAQAIWSDDNEQTRAFKVRTQEKLAKAKTV